MRLMRSIKNMTHCLDSKKQCNYLVCIECSQRITCASQQNKKFISIQGREGSGKSALCKKIVEKEEIVL